MAGWLEHWDYTAFKKEFKRLANGGIYHRNEAEDEREMGWAALLPYAARVQGGSRRASRISWSYGRPTEDLAILHADGWLFLETDIPFVRSEPGEVRLTCWCCGAHKSLSGFAKNPDMRFGVELTCKSCQDEYRERTYILRPGVKERDSRKAA